MGETLSANTVTLDVTQRKYQGRSLAGNNLRDIVAEWLRLGMQHSGLSQGKLADKAGVSRATVNRLVKKKRDAEQSTIKQLARAMKYPFPELDVAFPDQTPSDVKRDMAGPGRSQERRSVVRESSGNAYSGSEEADAAYLRAALELSRALSLGERDGLPKEALLRLVDLAEKVMVPVHGKRAKEHLDAERRRIQGGDARGGDGSPEGR